MRNAAIAAALALGLTLVPGCQRQATMPIAQPTSGEEDPDAFGGQPAGAVGTLESEEESGGHFATMADMLRGRVAGLQVSENANGDISIQIRGRQSFYAGEEPLLVVNGVTAPMGSLSSRLRSMDPRDVESIQVLKDVASTSIYGMRGANGVILIKLKRR